MSAQRRELGAHTFAGSRAGLRGGGVHPVRGRRLAAPLLSTSSGRRRQGTAQRPPAWHRPPGAPSSVGVTTATSCSPEIPRERPPPPQALSADIAGRWVRLQVGSSELPSGVGRPERSAISQISRDLVLIADFELLFIYLFLLRLEAHGGPQERKRTVLTLQRLLSLCWLRRLGASGRRALRGRLIGFT